MYVGRRKKKVVEQLNAFIKFLDSQQQSVNQIVKPIVPQQIQQPQYQYNSATENVSNTSIASLFRKFNTDKNQNSDKQVKTEQVIPTGEINQDDLLRLWRQYAANIEKSDPYMCSIMSNTPHAVGAEIHIDVNSQKISDNLTNATDLIEFLRKELNNNTIVICPQIVDNKSNNVVIVYTAKQKLEKMIESNQFIKSFIDDLDLDIEY